MRVGALLGIVAATACGPLQPLRADGGANDASVDGGGADAGQGDGGSPMGSIQVDVLLEGRSRLGARSARGYRPWRGGIAVLGDWLYWVESGTTPGLYRMPKAGCAPNVTCAVAVAALTRPSAFAATTTSVLVADVTALRRYSPTATPQPIATAASEFTLLATNDTTAFWAADGNPIMRTPFGGQTSTVINSNGSPYAMAVSNERLHWVGVDISGSTAAMQSVGLDGRGAREDRRSSNGFQTMHGAGRLLYFARDVSPAVVFRESLSLGLLEELADDALGVTDFASDATHVYWTEPGLGTLANGRVRRAAHDSTDATLVASALAFPVALTVSEGVVYVLAAGSANASYSDGKIVRISFR